MDCASREILDFELGPIRPPSEARSLLLRLTRNCPWNRCRFCPVYKGRSFELRSVEEIKEDIEAAAEMCRRVRAVAAELGSEDRIDDRVIRECLTRFEETQAFRHLLAWMYYGTGQVFLQDANSLIMKPDDLEEVLKTLRRALPEVQRVTTYARSDTAARRGVDELKRLKDAGLDRVHIGLESGFDPLLDFMQKGVTAEKHVRGGQQIRQAGLELSEYVMPGLGGRKWWKEHADATADVLNQINPQFIRLRTLRVPPMIPLYSAVQSGEFEKQSDDEIVVEIRRFVSRLKGITSIITSDHMMNLLETVAGKLPQDQARILKVLDDYLALDEHDRLLFKLGRRLGRCRETGDLKFAEVRLGLEQLLEKIRSQGDPSQFIDQLADGMI